MNKNYVHPIRRPKRRPFSQPSVCDPYTVGFELWVLMSSPAYRAVTGKFRGCNCVLKVRAVTYV